MEPLISVIIPIYNVEKYLDYCIQSVIAQDYQNLEIILIDDGSTDSSGSICDKYASKDSRIIVIHKENGGVSSARNAGINIMKGEYLACVDSDDYIRTDYISFLYKIISQDNTDMVICSYKKVVGDENFNTKTADSSNHYIFDKEETKLRMISRKLPMYPHGKLIKREIAIRMAFPVERIFEDVITCWNIMNDVNLVSYSDAKLYFYRQRPDSIINREFGPERMDQVYFAEQILDEVKDNPRLLFAAGSRCFFSAADNYSLITDKYPEEKAYLKESLKKYRKYVFKDKKAEISLKTMAFVSMFGLCFVRILGRAYKKKNQRMWKKE